MTMGISLCVTTGVSTTLMNCNCGFSAVFCTSTSPIRSSTTWQRTATGGTFWTMESSLCSTEGMSTASEKLQLRNNHSFQDHQTTHLSLLHNKNVQKSSMN